MRKTNKEKNILTKVPTFTSFLIIFLALALSASAATVRVQDGSLNISNYLRAGTNTLFVNGTNQSVIIGLKQGGTSGSAIASADLSIGGTYNAGTNINGAKLWIGDYDNDGTAMYPIYVEDENNLVDFWIKNSQTQSGTPTMYFKGSAGIGTTNPTTKLHVIGGILSGGLRLGENNIGYHYNRYTANFTYPILHTNNQPGYIATKDAFFRTNNDTIEIGLSQQIANYSAEGAISNGVMIRLRHGDGTAGQGVPKSIQFHTNNAERARFDENGNFGIGTTTPNATLTVASGKTTIADEWTVRSDRNIKTNVENYNSDSILDTPLQVYTYNLVYQETIYDDTDGDGSLEITGYNTSLTPTQLGLMADEVPSELVGANGKSIDLYALISYTLAYSQELKQENDALKAALCKNFPNEPVCE